MSSKTFRTVNNSYFCTIFKSEKLQRLICAYWVCFAPGSTARHPFFCFHNTSRDVPPWGTWLKTQHCWRKVGKDRKRTKRPNSNPRPPVYKACALPLCYNHEPQECFVVSFPAEVPERQVELVHPRSPAQASLGPKSDPPPRGRTSWSHREGTTSRLFSAARRFLPYIKARTWSCEEISSLNKCHNGI